MKPKDPMWALVMFDLPVDTKRCRREATRYRNYLLGLGFTRVQLSVYARYLLNADGITWLGERVGIEIPDGGLVRLIAITDNQWVTSLSFKGKSLVEHENAPDQLTFF